MYSAGRCSSGRGSCFSCCWVRMSLTCARGHLAAAGEHPHTAVCEARACAGFCSAFSRQLSNMCPVGKLSRSMRFCAFHSCQCIVACAALVSYATTCSARSPALLTHCQATQLRCFLCNVIVGCHVRDLPNLPAGLGWTGWFVSPWPGLAKWGLVHC
jgi:hypothetical protein